MAWYDRYVREYQIDPERCDWCGIGTPERRVNLNPVMEGTAGRATICDGCLDKWLAEPDDEWEAANPTLSGKARPGWNGAVY